MGTSMGYKWDLAPLLAVLGLVIAALIAGLVC
jgi:hypothetical protein